MPEALAVIVIFAVSAAVYVGALIQGRRRVVDQAAERDRAIVQQEWLTQRLALARRENWDARMVADIERQLQATAAELKQVSAR
jgi:hypothetical protein